MRAYLELEGRFRRLNALGQAAGVLQWDLAVMMPPGGAAARAEQLAALKVTSHALLTDPATGALLDRAADEDGLDDWQRANLREMRRAWLHATAVPPDLVEALTKACAACEQVWRQARPAADFKMLLPSLDAVLRLTRETAAAKAGRLGLSLYDALLDAYELGETFANLARVFAALREELVPLVQAVGASGRRPDLSVLQREYRTGPADARVDHDQEDGARRKVLVAGREFERARHDIVRRHLVRHVDEHGFGANRENHALHRPGVVVLRAEVRQQGDHGSSHARASRPRQRGFLKRISRCWWTSRCEATGSRPANSLSTCPTSLTSPGGRAAGHHRCSRCSASMMVYLV